MSIEVQEPQVMERRGGGVTARPSSSSLPLVERLDPALGEATTGLGALLTELIRRTLRGSVQKVDEEMQEFVAEKVDLMIADRTPVIERTAAEVAENTARAAATEVAVEEVKVLENKTTATAQELARQIEETERRAQTATTETAENLAKQIEETERRTQAATTETAQNLAKQIVEVDQRAQETTTATAQNLVKQIGETEQRVTETARTTITQQVQELIQGSKKITAQIREHLGTLDAKTTSLEEKQETVKAEFQQRVAGLLARLEQEDANRERFQESIREKLVKALTKVEAKYQEQLAGLQQANQNLEARLAELEKPRGIKGMFTKLFHRKPKES
jgi:chromosome segregation ATPase